MTAHIARPIELKGKTPLGEASSERGLKGNSDVNTTALSADERFVVSWDITKGALWLPVWGTPDYIRALTSGYILSGGQSDEGPDGVVELPDVTGMSTAEAAEAYAKAGAWVVPVRPGTKNPGSYLGQGWPQSATSDLDTVRSWWGRWPLAGIAMHVGPSRLLVIDVDRPENVPDELWPMLEAAVFRPTMADPDTRRGHYFYRLEEGQQFGCGLGALKPPKGKGWGDIKCYGGAVVLAPTVHPKMVEGHEYRCGPAAVVPLVPVELAHRLVAVADSAEYRPLSFRDLVQRSSGFLDAYTAEAEPHALEPILNSFDPTPDRRHPSMFEALCWAMREAKAGRFGAQRAADELRDVWQDAIGGHHRGGDIDEFDRMMRDAIGVADADSAEDLWERAHRKGNLDEDEAVRQEADRAYRRRKGDSLARERLAREDWSEPDDEGNLGHQIANPEPDEGHLVEGLIRSHGIAYLAAQYKAGKTTLASVNLPKALVTGQPFLGRFDVSFGADECVGIWNLEVDRQDLVDWLDQIGIPEDDQRRIFPKCLRGNRSVDFRNPLAVDWTVDWLRDRRIGVWVIDPLSKLYRGEENSNTEFNQWWSALEEIKCRAGVRVAMLVHHTGHQDRSRGASAMMGNPDVLIEYRHGGEHGSLPPDDKRYLRAFGRRINVDEFELAFNPATGELYASGGGGRAEGLTERHAIKAYDAMAAYTFQQRQSGIEGDVELSAGDLAEVARVLPKHRTEHNNGRNLAVQNGWLVERKQGTSKLYRLGKAPSSRGGEVV